MRRFWVASLLIVVLGASSLECYNRSLFFRTSAFWDEPRFTRPWLTTLDTQLSGGSGHQGRTGKGRCTSLLSLYGPEDIVALSSVPHTIPLDLKGDPKKICFRAIADSFEADFNLYQNLKGGFFLQFHLPVVIVRIFPSGFVEDQECCIRPCKENDSVWERPLEALTPFLKQFDLSVCRSDRPGLSDSTLFVGWSYSYEDTCYLDFVDMTFKTGVLFPTGRKRNIDHLFEIPYGYNGHWAVPLSWDITIGAFDWLSLGFHSEALFFFDKQRKLRMRTQEEALTGLIVLGKGRALVDQGIVWKLGTYFKADHFFYGLSLIFAFSYEQKNKDSVSPCNSKAFNADHINCDPYFQKWARSIFHFQADYDFAHEDSSLGTRVGIFYNHEMTGHRVFNIDTTGGYLGLDVSWCF